MSTTAKPKYVHPHTLAKFSTEKFTAALEAAKITRADLATKLASAEKLDRGAVRRWSHHLEAITAGGSRPAGSLLNSVQPSPKSLERIAAALGVKPGDLCEVSK